MKIKFNNVNENNNRVNITRPAWPTSAFAQDLKAMYGEFLEPGEEDKQAYEDASQYLLESNKKYEAEQVVKAYASGGWRKALSVIADLGIAGTAGLFGVAMFGLYTWGGPITAAAIGFGLLHALLVGTYGEVIKSLLLGADNLLRRNPKMEKLFSLAKKDAQATEIVKSIKKEMDKEKPVKDTLKILKKDLEKRLKELEKEQVSFKEDADMKYVLEGNLFDNIRAKQKRIAKGSGEEIAKPGDEDYPENLKKIAKEAALNEELFKANFAMEIDGRKTAVVDAKNEDDAISKIIEKFNIDVENIKDLKKVESDNENYPDTAINESYTNEDLLELFEALELDTYKYNFEYLAEQLGFEVLDEEFFKDLGTNIKGITKDSFERARDWRHKGGERGAILGSIAGGAGAGPIINTGLERLNLPRIFPEGDPISATAAGGGLGWALGSGAGVIAGFPVGIIQGLKKANKGIYLKPQKKITTDDKIDSLTNTFNDYISKQNNINPVTNEPNNTVEIPVENKDSISEASRNAPHVIKGKYIRLDNGQVIEPEPDYWDDYVPPKIEKPVKPEVVKDPSDNPDLYEFDDKGQMRFKLKESSSLLTKYGVEGYNKPKRTPSHKTKSHLVVAKKGDKIKVVRFGAQGVSGSPKKDGESEAYRKRREGFVARHKAQNPSGMKDKFSPLYWANKEKW